MADDHNKPPTDQNIKMAFFQNEHKWSWDDPAVQEHYGRIVEDELDRILRRDVEKGPFNQTLYPMPNRDGAAPPFNVEQIEKIRARARETALRHLYHSRIVEEHEGRVGKIRPLSIEQVTKMFDSAATTLDNWTEKHGFPRKQYPGGKYVRGSRAYYLEHEVFAWMIWQIELRDGGIDHIWPPK